MASDEHCGSCRFFNRIQIGQAQGNCHARAPQVVMIGQIKHPVTGMLVPATNTYWPQLPDTEWCGDFVRRQYAAIDLSKMDVQEMEGAG